MGTSTDRSIRLLIASFAILGSLLLARTATAANLPAPSLTAPSNGQTGVSTMPGFQWSNVSGELGFRIAVATSAGALPTDPTSPSCPGSCVVNATTGS
ncbi:MAG: hypothetical protein ACHQZS_00845, partial [Candidatus Binatales bacterium]